MQVNIKFDTEKERLENLKKLVDALQQLINYREGKNPSVVKEKIDTPQIVEDYQIQKEENTITELKETQKTEGGCRVVPFENMDSTMSQIFSGRKF